MSIATKSVQLPRSKSDGVRVCIMRRPGEDVGWDIWMPTLAPSHELLTEYHEGVVDWDGFTERFSEEVLVGQKQHLELLLDMARNRKITLLCWEKDPAECHRRLVAEECMRMDKTLEVVVK